MQHKITICSLKTLIFDYFLIFESFKLFECFVKFIFRQKFELFGIRLFSTKKPQNQTFNVFKLSSFVTFEIEKNRNFSPKIVWFVGFKKLEILDYIPKYVRYEGGPKRWNVRFKSVFTAIVFTEASVTYLRKFPG